MRGFPVVSLVVRTVMVSTRLSVAALLVIATSCARPSTRGDGPPPPAGGVPRAAKNPNVITAEELHAPLIISMDALNAIRYLRPAFFRTSGPQSFGNVGAGLVQISPDFGPLQPLSQLRSFTTITLFEVRYLDANEAQVRFGLNANGGPVIVLVSGKE